MHTLSTGAAGGAVALTPSTLAAYLCTIHEQAERRYRQRRAAVMHTVDSPDDDSTSSPRELEDMNGHNQPCSYVHKSPAGGLAGHAGGPVARYGRAPTP